MSLADRKVAEVEHRLTGLERELDHWRDEAAEGHRLAKHHTQVTAVRAELRVPLGTLRNRIERIGGAGVLDVAAGIEGVVVDLHRIWDVFRTRLALRYVQYFAEYLLGVDELAYRCYVPAEERGAGREPPLVSFGDIPGPVTRPRGQALRPWAALSDDDAIGEPLRRLQVPLIELPWFHLEHLPDAPIIAHEVGHDVEADLGLSARLDAVVDAALERCSVCECRRRAWRTWREEAFADVFGTLALGPAFTATLIDFLAVAPRTVATEWQSDPDWRPHPPATLRILLSAATLEWEGSAGDDERYADEARTLRDAWRDAYPRHALKEFEADVEHVAHAIVAGPYDILGNGPLTELIRFPRASHDRACRDARDLVKGIGADSLDARELIAAARLAFNRDSAAYDAKDVSRAILTQIERAPNVGLRTGTQAPVDEDAVAASGASTGRWLDDYLSAAHGLEPSDDGGDGDVQAHND